MVLFRRGGWRDLEWELTSLSETEPWWLVQSLSRRFFILACTLIDTCSKGQLGDFQSKYNSGSEKSRVMYSLLYKVWSVPIKTLWPAYQQRVNGISTKKTYLAILPPHLTLQSCGTVLKLRCSSLQLIWWQQK